MSATRQSDHVNHRRSVELDEIRTDSLRSPEPTIENDNEATVTQYPQGLRLLLITIGLVLSIFTSAVSKLDLATATSLLT